MLDAGEGIAGSDVGEAHERLHERELPAVIELQARDAFAAGQHGSLAELSKRSTVYKGFQDVLPHIEIPVGDPLQRLAQLWQVLHGFGDTTSR